MPLMILASMLDEARLNDNGNDKSCHGMTCRRGDSSLSGKIHRWGVDQLLHSRGFEWIHRALKHTLNYRVIMIVKKEHGTNFIPKLMALNFNDDRPQIQFTPPRQMASSWKLLTTMSDIFIKADACKPRSAHYIAIYTRNGMSSYNQSFLSISYFLFIFDIEW